MGELVPLRRRCAQHVTAFHDPIRAILSGEDNSPSTVAPLRRLADLFVVLQDLFVITPLNWAEWKAVLYISLPVILLDEILKLVSQLYVAPPSKIKQE